MKPEPGHPPATPAGSADDDSIVAQTRLWLERAVIGLNLCPFAQPVYVQRRIRYRVTRAADGEALRSVLAGELQALHVADPAQIETTLLIHPAALTEFLDYNEFLGTADDLLRQLQLEGIFQIASFHPHYCFAGTEPDDITNYTNRSPYPMLHLLRESSVAQAVSGPTDAARIVERNQVTLRRLGLEGLRRLGIPGTDGP